MEAARPSGPAMAASEDLASDVRWPRFGPAATHDSLALARTNAVTRGELQAAQLREALDSRDAIGQAKGILMARRGISAEEAFEVLRRTSQDVNVKLRDLADTVTARRAEIDQADDER